MVVTRDEIIALQEELLAATPGRKTRNSALAHLNAALFDWDHQKQWVDPQAHVLTIEGKGYIFFRETKFEPRYVTLMHVFVLEKYRLQGIGKLLMELMYQCMKDKGINLLRFFADKPSIRFYETLGYKWHGLSKTGLPFFYGTVFPTIELIDLPPRQQRYVVTSMEAGE